MKDDDPSIITELLHNTKVAVVIIDKQQGYIFRHSNPPSFIGGTDALQAMIPKLDSFIRTVRRKHIPVVWAKMLENSRESLPNIAFKIKYEGDYPLTVSGEDSVEIAGEQPAEGEKVIVKIRYDAFTGSDLHDYLQAQKIQTVILTGAYASRCVLATAFAANSLGYNVIMVRDLVANPDNFQTEMESALSIVTTILGFITDSTLLLELWKGTERTNA